MTTQTTTEATVWPPPEPPPKICRGTDCDVELHWYWKDGAQHGPSWRRGRWRSPEELECDACGSANRERKHAASKPQEWPPEEPPPAECTEVGCKVQIPYVWRDGPWYGPLYKQGRWVAPSDVSREERLAVKEFIPDPGCGYLCEEHIATRKATADAKALRKSITSSGLPIRMQSLRWSRYLEYRDADGQIVKAANRDSVTQEDFLRFTNSIPPDTVGITPWNRHLAGRLRSLSGPSARIETTVIMGEVGSGKSTLMAAAIIGLLARGVVCRYITEAELWALVREQWSQTTKKQHRARDVIEQLVDVPVLALDDIGTTESPKPWIVDGIERLVCARYDLGRPMLFTTNVDMDGLANIYGERVGSRLSEMTGRGARYIHLGGPDWRTGVMRHAHQPATATACHTCGRTPCRCECSECGYHPCRDLASCQ